MAVILLDRQKKEQLASGNIQMIEEKLIHRETTWKFNPPAAPHFGGTWESLVKCCKRGMFAIFEGRSLKDEILNTSFCLVEQTLNACPSTPVRGDPNVLEALTPNQLPLGRSDITFSFLPSKEPYTALRKRFRTAQVYSNIFWQRWTKEWYQQTFFNLSERKFKKQNSSGKLQINKTSAIYEQWRFKASQTQVEAFRFRFWPKTRIFLSS